jgi:hypothetical protein
MLILEKVNSDYSSFEDPQAGNQLQNIGNHRIGSIGISCPGFNETAYDFLNPTRS